MEIEEMLHAHTHTHTHTHTRTHTHTHTQALKDACRPCVEIEEMLGLDQAMGKVKKELMHLQTLRLEARKLKRESQALDLVVNRYVLQCVALCCIVLYCIRQEGMPVS